MTTFKQNIWAIADSLRTELATGQLVDELILLLLWLQLSRKEEGLPSLESVIDGRKTLASVYQELAARLEDAGSSYIYAKLPTNLAGKKLCDLLLKISKIEEIEDDVLLQEIVTLASEQSHTAADCVLPTELVDLMATLGGTDSDQVYCPFPASLQLAATMAQQGVMTDYESPQANSPLSAAAVMLTGLNWSQSDPLKSPHYAQAGQLTQYPVVLMAPPFGLRVKEKITDLYSRFSSETSNGDVLVMEHALAQSAGKIIALMPIGFLFRGANDYDLRAKLVNNAWLDTIIQLPPGLLNTTQIPLAIVMLDKQRDSNTPVLLCDADQPHWITQGGRAKANTLTGWREIADIVTQRKAVSGVMQVTTEEIKAQDYDLSISRYVLGKASQAMQTLQAKEPSTTLDDVADLIRAQALKEDKIPSGDVYLEVGLKDVAEDGYVTPPSKSLTLSGRAQQHAERQRLYPGDVLLVTKGNVGRVAIVGEHCGTNWVANQSYQVVRLKGQSAVQSPLYLYRYLKSPLVQAFINEQVTGTTIPMLATRDIKSLPVILKSIEQQQAVLDTHQQIQAAFEQLRQIQAQIEQLNQAHWPFKASSEQ